ncbi:MAG: response regulator transcription factor [Planctomycetota bacterium]|nr:response regulator transcription factor [Planctomycetota bacterium]
MQILIVEDDSVLGAALEKGLTEIGHICSWTQNGISAVQLSESNVFDVIILDLMLPDLSGLEVLRQLRQRKNEVSVLLLSALGSVEDRVKGLNTGADDYLVKPFAYAELVARIVAIERRKVKTQITDLTAGTLSIELTSRRVTRNEVEIDLTPTEYKLLEFLMRNANQVVTRRMLCEHLWESDWEGVTNVIEVHINRLRNKIKKGFDTDLIHTIRGSGYELRED